MFELPFYASVFACSYLAHHSLHDSVKSPLWTIPVSGYLRLFHFLREASYLLCQGQNILESELSLAFVRYSEPTSQQRHGLSERENQPKLKVA